jgi:putative ABC transport system permease protein
LALAALVAIYSFRYNIQNDVNDQAATLIGADLTITGNKQPDAKSCKSCWIAIGDDRSEERSFPSMVYFTKSQDTRLVQVKALSKATSPITANWKPRLYKPAAVLKRQICFG